MNFVDIVNVALGSRISSSQDSQAGIISRRIRGPQVVGAANTLIASSVSAGRVVHVFVDILGDFIPRTKSE